MHTHLSYFLAGAGGLLLQTLLKIKALIDASARANHKFSYKEYFATDWPTIGASLLTVGLAVSCVDELLNVRPELEKYIKWFFICVGYMGSSIIQSALSVFTKKINAVIDIKTNIADGINPPVDASNVEGVQEIKKDEDAVNSAKK